MVSVQRSNAKAVVNAINVLGEREMCADVEVFEVATHS